MPGAAAQPTRSSAPPEGTATGGPESGEKRPATPRPRSRRRAPAASPRGSSGPRPPRGGSAPRARCWTSSTCTPCAGRRAAPTRASASPPARRPFSSSATRAPGRAGSARWRTPPSSRTPPAIRRRRPRAGRGRALPHRRSRRASRPQARGRHQRYQRRPRGRRRGPLRWWWWPPCASVCPRPPGGAHPGPGRRRGGAFAPCSPPARTCSATTWRPCRGCTRRCGRRPPTRGRSSCAAGAVWARSSAKQTELTTRPGCRFGRRGAPPRRALWSRPASWSASARRPARWSPCSSTARTPASTWSPSASIFSRARTACRSPGLWEPAEFAAWERRGAALGLGVTAAPFVRSSYRAGESLHGRHGADWPAPRPAGGTRAARASLPTPALVMFDLDYTLVRPSDLFEAPGYRRTGERFGLRLDEALWPQAERRAVGRPWATRPDR